MKASEEIAADMFIRQCIRRGIDTQREIVEEARKHNSGSITATDIRNFIHNGNSVPYEDRGGGKECLSCNNAKLFDESREEYYCPVCEL